MSPASLVQQCFRSCQLTVQDPVLMVMRTKQSISLRINAEETEGHLSLIIITTKEQVEYASHPHCVMHSSTFIFNTYGQKGTECNDGLILPWEDRDICQRPAG